MHKLHLYILIFFSCSICEGDINIFYVIISNKYMYTKYICCNMI